MAPQSRQPGAVQRKVKGGSQSGSMARLPGDQPGSIKKSMSAPQLRPGDNKKGQPATKTLPATKQTMGGQSAMTDAERSRRKEMKEGRRKIMETLSNPEVPNVAKKLFEAQAKKPNGRLQYDDFRRCLRDLDKQLGITFPTKAEKLFKRFDVNGDGSLSFDEFYELFISSLRRCTFDRNALEGREIFVTKQKGSVWDTFEQNKKIGEGTFGSAYLAKNKKTGEDRVVKAVKKSRAQVPVEDIEKEIMVMLQVDHPHIVRLFRWYEDQHFIYLVLEALKGGTLCEVLTEFAQKGKPLKEEWGRKVIRQVMEAMAYCHSLRLIHKDLKDENIMLLKKDPNYDEPHAVVIDLGIAEMFSNSDPTCRVIGGTPLTMAPEVWKGDFGPKADVWSLGCILYEMLAGKFPFEAPSINPRDWLTLHKRGPDWSALKTSPTSTAMCQVMLKYNDAERPTMKDCLKHEWFEVKRQQLTKLSAEKLKPLLEMHKQTDIKRAVLLDVASRLPMDKAGRVVEVFKSFDLDGNASLSLEELRASFKQMGIKDEALIKNTFDALDSDKDGSLSFTEFAAGVLLVFGDLLDERFLKAFEDNDLDSDGYLTKEECSNLLVNSLQMATRNKNGVDVVAELYGGGVKKINYKDLRQKILGNVAS